MIEWLPSVASQGLKKGNIVIMGPIGKSLRKAEIRSRESGSGRDGKPAIWEDGRA